VLSVFIAARRGVMMCRFSGFPRRFMRGLLTGECLGGICAMPLSYAIMKRTGCDASHTGGAKESLSSVL